MPSQSVPRCLNRLQTRTPSPSPRTRGEGNQIPPCASVEFPCLPCPIFRGPSCFSWPSCSRPLSGATWYNTRRNSTAKGSRDAMREQLEGRNLAHVGCLIGLILGLSGGIILAWTLILHSVAAIFALLLWFGLTVML